jgi:hydroxymethylpyrimidine/phosphomethylpyrimidine kinase
VKGRVLVVAGSDSGGGAGIQADIKAVTALGGYAMTAVTALTAQNTQGVFGVHAVPDSFVAQQMELALDDIGADAIKTGMLHSASIIETVSRVVEARAPNVPLVVDPVMVAKGGHPLIDREALNALKAVLILHADLVTPNLPEAEMLSGREIRDEMDMRRAAESLLTLGAQAALVKGGHLPGSRVIDLLMTHDGIVRFEGHRIDTQHTHGTGCTLASAIATGLAQGLALSAAVDRARAYVRKAIATAPGFGRGHGPLNHAHTVMPFEGG